MRKVDGRVVGVQWTIYLSNSGASNFRPTAAGETPEGSERDASLSLLILAFREESGQIEECQLGG